MAASISDSIVACLRKFNDFIEELEGQKKDTPEGLYVSAWQDELGRLRVWAANIGAHQTGQSSLDYRLRDSSHIRQQIIKLLDELLKRLRDAQDVIREGEDGDEDVESLEGSDSENDDPQTEIQQLRGSIATIINCLFQMSMLVRKPAQHDLRTGSKKADVAAFEPYDRNHVADKYPKANEILVSRLGHAITKRRRYLKYRERHSMKLKQGINKVVTTSRNDDRTETQAGTEVLSETIATDTQSWNVDFDDKASESGLSQTSYAPTLVGGGAITIPSPPRASQDGAPFECPYCYYVITIQSTRSWHRHVFGDLQPYICTEASCATPDKLYTTRHEWIHHMRTVHRSDSPTPEDRRICGLCGDSLDTGERHDRHLARHLQELALFVLPRNDEDSDASELSDDSASDTGPAIEPSEEIQGENSAEWISFEYSEKGNTSEYQICCEFTTLAVDRFTPAFKTDNCVYPQAMAKFKDYKGDRFGYEAECNVIGWALADLNPSLRGKRGLVKKAVDCWRGSERGRSHTESAPAFFGNKPTYVKVHSDHLSPATLDAYNLPWEWLKEDARYLVVKRWIPEYDQETLFEHTRKLRRGDFVGYPEMQKLDAVTKNEQKPHDGDNNGPERPTYVKVHRKHLLPATLDAYQLPWEWDSRNDNYIIIRRWIPEPDQDILFDHTRRLLNENSASDNSGQPRQKQDHDQPSSDEESHEIDGSRRSRGVTSSRNSSSGSTSPIDPELERRLWEKASAAADTMEVEQGANAAKEIAKAPTAPGEPAEEEEDYTIKCFCNFQVDDGNTVFCDRCETWQHIECYYYGHFQDGHPPDINQIVHSCIDCEPRLYDKKGATGRQRDRFYPEERKVKKPPTETPKRRPKLSESTPEYVDSDHSSTTEKFRAMPPLDSSPPNRTPQYIAVDSKNPDVEEERASSPYDKAFPLSRTDTSHLDILIMQCGGNKHLLRFPTSSIADGLPVGTVRREAARSVGCEDYRRVLLMYKARSLADDSRSCKSEGLKQGSTLLGIVTNDIAVGGPGPEYEASTTLAGKMTEAHKLAAESHVCPRCSDEFPADLRLWEHARTRHADDIGLADMIDEQAARKGFREEASSKQFRKIMSDQAPPQSRSFFEDAGPVALSNVEAMFKPDDPTAPLTVKEASSETLNRPAPAPESIQASQAPLTQKVGEKEEESQADDDLDLSYSLEDIRCSRCLRARCGTSIYQCYNCRHDDNRFRICAGCFEAGKWCNNLAHRMMKFDINDMQRIPRNSVAFGD